MVETVILFKLVLASILDIYKVCEHCYAVYKHKQHNDGDNASGTMEKTSEQCGLGVTMTEKQW